VELIEWLKTTDPETAEYFGALCKLYSSLARGRNLRTTPVLQKLLPCKLVVKIIRLCAADERFLPIAQSFVSIASDLYINNDLFNEAGDIIEAHPPMVKVTHVRVWEEVESIAATGALSSKKNLSTAWDRFDELKSFASSFLEPFHYQHAMDISKNGMVFKLVEMIYLLIQGGFYNVSQLTTMIPYLLRLLDGRGDVVDEQLVSASERYQRRSTVKVNTVLLMQTKQQICMILQLICTLRLDIRLSSILDI
jgi:hypothetical protein